MIYRARIEVALKPGHSDPEGETTAKSLKELGYPVEATKVSKVYEITLSVRSVKEASRLVDEMCRRLLANPTKDNYSFTIEEV
jgi:phosphoribosylformylglycinamidine synthase PurS subunit